MTPSQRYNALLGDVRQLKKDFEDLAHGQDSHTQDVLFDAADMTKFVLEKDEERQ